MRAFEEIYRASNSFVYNTALRITRSTTDAEEVTQDVFMKIHRNLKDFRFRAKFSTWLYRITVNTAINRYHSMERIGAGRVSIDDAEDKIASDSRTEEGAIRAESAQSAEKMLGTLPAEQRACLILREIEALSYQDIATALGIPVNTVRTRLKRGREALIARFS